ncbi:MAG: hypothetical protein GX224_04260, partial [Thermoplasmatales archaeon]|nr:hypothetical protein [Thermoplasmatales archaeon]
MGRKNHVVTVLLAMAFVAVSAMVSLPHDCSDAAGPYTVTFDPNGGTATPAAYSASVGTATSGGSLMLPPSSFTVGETAYEYSRPGYVFSGWAESRADIEPSFVAGNIMPVSSNTVLYAVWSPNDYDVTFTVGGASETVRIPFGTTYDTSQIFDLDAKPGFRLIGWSTQEPIDVDNNGAYMPVAGSTCYVLDVTLKSPGDVTLYPVYGKVCNVSTGPVQITDGSGCYYLTGTHSTNGVTVSGGSPKVTVENLNVDFTNFGTERNGASPFVISDGAAVSMTLVGNNTLYGRANVVAKSAIKQGFTDDAYYGFAAMDVMPGTTLTITSESTGTLTAKGGDATIYGVFSHQFSGPGIGGNWIFPKSKSAFDMVNPCGTINIEGGTVNAYGGNLNTHPARFHEGTVSSSGIGGTNGQINISGGTVSAERGEQSGTTYNVIMRPDIYPDATVSGTAEVHYETDGTVTYGTSVQVRFTTTSSIPDVTLISIDGTGVAVSKVTVANGTVVRVPSQSIGHNSVVSISTATSFHGGTAVWNAADSRYDVGLSSSMCSVDVATYSNDGGSHRPTGAGGRATHGTVSPHGRGAVSAPNWDDKVPIEFFFRADPGYELSGVALRPYDMMRNNPGAWGPIAAGDLSIVPLGDGEYSVTVMLVDGRYDVSFQVERISLPVTVKVDMSSNPGWVPASQLVTVNSGTLNWNTDNTQATHSVLFGEDRTYTVHPAAFGGNPCIPMLATVNGEPVPLADAGDGKYALTVKAFASETTIKISYHRTVKVTVSAPTLESTGEPVGTASITLYDGNGDPLTTVPDGPNSSSILLLRGSDIEFRVAQGDSHRIKTVVMDGAEVPLEADGRYFVENVTDDVTVAATLVLSAPVNDRTVTYFAEAGSRYVMHTTADVNVFVPVLEDFPRLGLTPKHGYDLVWWRVHGTYDGEYDTVGRLVAPGVEASVWGPVDCFALWSDSPAEYGLTYDLAGGTPSGLYPATYNVNSSIYLEYPTKYGHAFAGWTGTGLTSPTLDVSILPGSVGDRHYVANWNPVSVVVTMVDGTETVGTRTHAFGETYQTTYLLKPGQTFGGWSLAPDGSSKITCTTTVDNENDHEIYAVWIPDGHHVINVVSPVEGGTVSAPASVPGGGSATVTLRPYVGYAVKGVIIDGGALIPLGGNTHTIVNVTSPVTVEAVFEPVEYTVTVHRGPGQTPATDVYHYNMKSDSWQIIPPAKIAGYEFIGWTGDGITGVRKDFVHIEKGTMGNLVFHEVWIPEYRIFYHLYQGVNPAGSPNRYSGTETVTLPSPVKVGHDFGGWYSNAGHAGDAITKIQIGETGDKEFHAKWILRTFKVHFDMNGAAVAAPPSAEGPYRAPVELPLDDPPGTYVRPGYGFGGWSTSPNGLPVDAYFVQNEDTTLYAVWIADAATVSFDIGDGVGDVPARILGKPGDPVSLPGSEGFRKTGHEFKGWAESPGGTPVTVPYAMPVCDTVLHAVWEPGTYQITWVWEGELNGSPAIFSESETYAYGIMPSYESPPTYTDAYGKHEFIGWSPTITPVAGDKTYTASFRCISQIPVITPIAVGGFVYNGQVQVGVPYGEGFTLKKDSAKEVGNYSAEATLLPNYYWADGDPNPTKIIAWSISKARLTVTADDISVTVGSPVPDYTMSYQGFVTGDTFHDLVGDVAVTSAYAVGTPAGSLPITFTGQYSSDNYDIAHVEGTLTVSASPGTYVVSVKPQTYTGSGLEPLPYVSDPISGTSLVQGTDFTVDGYSNNIDVGTAGLTVRITATGETIPAQFRINRADVPAPAGLVLVYDGTTQYAPPPVDGTLGWHYAAGSVTSGVDVCKHQVTVVLNDKINCQWPDGTTADRKIMWRISPKPVTVTADDVTVRFMETPTYGATYAGLAVGDVGSDAVTGLTFSSPYALGSLPGTYPIAPSGQASGNYLVTYAGGTLTVLERLADGLTIDPIPPQTYVGAPLRPSLTVKDGGRTLVEGIDYVAQYSNNVNVTTATNKAVVTVSWKGGYVGSPKTAEFAIAPAVVRVPVPADFVYDGTEQTGVGTSTLYTVSGTSRATDAKPDYVATLSLADKANHVWSTTGTNTDVDVTWGIAPAPVTVTPSGGQTKGYGDAEPDSFGFALSDSSFTSFEGALGREPGEIAGQYPINIGTLKSTDPNHALVMAPEPVYFTITKIKLTKPTADTTEFTYDGTEKVYAPQGVDTSTMSAFNDRRMDAGTQTVAVSIRDKANHEWADGTIGDVTFQFTVKPIVATFTVTLGYDTVVYDGSAKEPPVTVTGPLGTVDPGQYDVSYGANNVDAGTVTVAVTGKTGGNYKGSSGSKDFLIQKATLTAKYV